MAGPDMGSSRAPKIDRAMIRGGVPAEAGLFKASARVRTGQARRRRPKTFARPQLRPVGRVSTSDHPSMTGRTP